MEAIIITLILIGVVYLVSKSNERALGPESLEETIGSPDNEYELIQFDQAMFTGGTTSERFQERVGRYIHNGYRIHTMNVVVKQGWLAGQKQTYTVLFEKLPQPLSEGAAMLNS